MNGRFEKQTTLTTADLCELTQTFSFYRTNRCVLSCCLPAFLQATLLISALSTYAATTLSGTLLIYLLHFVRLEHTGDFHFVP
jgi:hypothetical protein